MEKIIRDEGEEAMVEFEIDESFDDWTASFLELTSLDMDQT